MGDEMPSQAEPTPHQDVGIGVSAVNMGIARNTTEDQAPIWMKWKALQWLFRLGKKTQRMWRYLLNKPEWDWLRPSAGLPWPQTVPSCPSDLAQAGVTCTIRCKRTK